jgi:hypothetical protein
VLTKLDGKKIMVGCLDLSDLAVEAPETFLNMIAAPQFHLRLERRRAPARSTTATTMYREPDRRFWLEQAEAESWASWRPDPFSQQNPNQRQERP